MSSLYRVRKATEDDKKSVLYLLNKVFLPQQRYDWERDERYWSWKYESNIFGKTIVLVIEYNNKIVGCSTLWPWKFVIRGEKFFTYQPCDTVVDFEHQSKGLFSLLNSFRLPLLKESNVSFVFNFPNKNSLPGNLSAGWNFVDKLPWMFKILNPVGTIRSLTNKAKCSPLSLLPHDAIDPEKCSDITENLLPFNKYLTTSKENGFFDWRFKKHPYFHYGQIIVEKGRKKAGAIYSVNQKGSSREMLVVDLLGSPLLTALLFDKLKVKANEYNVDFIATLYSRFYQMNKLIKKGYLIIHKKNMVVLPFDIRLENIVSKTDNWNLEASMHDSV